MPTYALLGVTGQVGSQILTHLHSRASPPTLHIYARSLSKIHAKHPFVASSPSIHAFTGSLNDTSLFTKCLRNTDVVFCTVASQGNKVDDSTAQQTVQTVVEALQTLKAEQGTNFKCPTVVLLTSANLNPVFRAAEPWFLKQVIDRGSYYVYADLRKAIQFMEDRPWIPLICAQPSALVEDEPRGFELSQDKVEPFLSYADLAAGMVRLAEEGDGKRWVGEKVGISPTGKSQGSVLPLLRIQFWGLLTYFFGWP